MAKQKKQFTELSDEELKQVTGGRGFEPKCYPKTSYEGGVCPSSYADKGDECYYGGGVSQYGFGEGLTLYFAN